MMDAPATIVTTPPSRRRAVTLRLTLVFVGLLLGLGAAEGLLALAGIPPSSRPHSPAKQFIVLKESYEGYPIHFNLPSSDIRFVYDSNPRGYFGPHNEIDHQTNSLGFRGPEFQLSAAPGGTVAHPQTVRLAFLGDSFTFGEGVRFADTYPERTAALLNEQAPALGKRFESYNFSVSGYNTTEELFMLERFALDCSPDAVVLGYVLNDAEPPLFEFAPDKKNEFRRRPRAIEESAAQPMPPENLLFRLRTARAVWSYFASRDLTRQTTAYYHSIYEDSSPGWQESRRSLRRIAEICRQKKIPCCVVLFPILYELDSRYPFRDIHAKIAEALDGTGSLLVDLLPQFEGHRAEDLWVHPADHHPNEKAHALAAEALRRTLLESHCLDRAAATAPAAR